MMKSFSMSSFVIGVMLGAMLAAAWFFGGNFISVPVSFPSDSSITEASTTPISQESGAVSVTNQSAGTIVLIESVTVPPPGVWVAVREISGTVLGNVLGAARVDGPRSSIFISLLRATDPYYPYAVELYRDDNNGAFDPAANSVYVDFTTGAPVIVYFTTTE